MSARFKALFFAAAKWLRPPDAEADARRADLWGLTVLLACTLLMFCGVLSNPGRVLSAPRTDTWHIFLPYRAFATREILHGHWPAWCPQIYGGMPFLANFESAMFYPPNLIFLVLPLGMAINLSFVSHILLLGVFTFLWSRADGRRVVPATMGAVLTMFGGSVFGHLYAGHLPTILTIAWTPLLLLAADRCLLGERRGLVLGSFALGMQLLAGHPQYALDGALVVFAYASLRLWISGASWRGLGMLVLVYIFGALLAAGQIIPGLEAAREGARVSMSGYKMVVDASLPPVELLTLFAPRLFGDMVNVPYWYTSRFYFWECCMFVSVTAVVLAFLGAFRVRTPGARVALWMVVALLVAALGKATPLYRFLCPLPGFSLLRGPSKFVFYMTLFLNRLAELGLDDLGHRHPVGRRTTGSLFLVALAFAGGAWGVHAVFTRQPLALGLLQTLLGGPVWLPGPLVGSQKARALAVSSLLVAAAMFALVACVLMLARRHRAVLYVLPVMAILEVFNFSGSLCATFSMARYQASVNRFHSRRPGDRILEWLSDPNGGLLTGARNVWGLDPDPLARYLDFIRYTQQLPLHVYDRDFLAFRGVHPLYVQMLRLDRVYYAGQDGMRSFDLHGACPRLMLVGHCTVMHGEPAILAALSQKGFDPRHEVILESQPVPAPVDGVRGTMRVVSEDSDSMTIEGVLDRPALLVVTDAYARDWVAEPLAGSAQSRYQVMPADYILRGIPLEKGRQRFRLVYRPRFLLVAESVSAVSWLVLLLVWGGAMFRRRRACGLTANS